MKVGIEAEVLHHKCRGTRPFFTPLSVVFICEPTKKIFVVFITSRKLTVSYWNVRNFLKLTVLCATSTSQIKYNCITSQKIHKTVYYNKKQSTVEGYLLTWQSREIPMTWQSYLLLDRGTVVLCEVGHNCHLLLSWNFITVSLVHYTCAGIPLQSLWYVGSSRTIGTTS